MTTVCTAIDSERGIITYSSVIRRPRADYVLRCALLLFCIVGATSHCGCASGWLYEPEEMKVEAIQVAKSAFGNIKWEVPSVFVLPSSMMNCRDGHGWMFDGDCIDGASGEPSFLGGPAWIELAPYPTWAESALCHEMGHASLFMRGLSGDHDHETYVFAADGPVVACLGAIAVWEATKMVDANCDTCSVRNGGDDDDAK